MAENFDAMGIAKYPRYAELFQSPSSLIISAGRPQAKAHEAPPSETVCGKGPGVHVQLSKHDLKTVKEGAIEKGLPFTVGGKPESRAFSVGHGVTLKGQSQRFDWTQGVMTHQG